MIVGFRKHVRGRIVVAVFVVWTAGSVLAAEEVNTMIQIPFSPKEVGHCYERLQKTEPVYRETIDQIQSILKSKDPFEERLRRSLQVHMEMLERTHQDMESEFANEDIYLCCLYDMLEALYASEARSILESMVDEDAKKTTLTELLESIEQLPFGSPQFKTGVRPRLQRHIQDAMKALDR